MPKILAFTGKGGVGKTSISAITVRLLKEAYPDAKILAIDADPAIGLSTALGMEAIHTVDEIRNLFIKYADAKELGAAVEVLADAKYQLMDALVEKDNVSFLAIGRPEAAGCYCKVNTYLKEVISLIAKNYDYVVIDGEAGIEQVNRRVMEHVSHLIFVSDASKKGLQVVKTIHDVAQNLVMFNECGLIVNRMINLDYPLDTHGIKVLATIPDDSNMSQNDMEGKSVFEMSSDTPIVSLTKKALEKLQILSGGEL